MKTKRIIATIICIATLLFLVPAQALTSAEKENAYNAAVMQLETYLESVGRTTIDLEGVLMTFTELGGYSQSLQFSYYTLILLKISNGEYDLELDNYLFMLEANEGFKSYLADMRSDSSIGTIDELKAYAQAREAENRGMTEQAKGHYMNCLNFYDSTSRYYELVSATDRLAYEKADELVRTGDLAGAYFAFKEIERYNDSTDRMAAIILQLGYTPSSPTDNLKAVENLRVAATSQTGIKLAWQKSSHATAYDVYYKEHSASAWTQWNSVTETSASVTGLSEGANYDFKVIATIGRIMSEETILLDQRTQKVTPTPEPTLTPNPGPTSRQHEFMTVGNIVKYGHYEQDNVISNGLEEIEWIVLDYDENEHKALLISRYGLDAKPYHTEYTYITWEDCSLRAWLNHDFLNAAFSIEERSAILITSVDNNQGYWHAESWRRNTQDQVFLLSYAEANRYLYVTLRSSIGTRAAPTAYAVTQGARASNSNLTAEGKPAGWWWLRSPGNYPTNAACVSLDGSLLYSKVNHSDHVVRPAFWINLESDIF